MKSGGFSLEPDDIRGSGDEGASKTPKVLGSKQVNKKKSGFTNLST